MNKNSYQGFTLVEILIVIILLGILMVVTVNVLGLNRNITKSADIARQEDIKSVLRATTLYITRNGGDLPTYNNGTMLPVVEQDTVVTSGAQVTALDNISPDYLNTLPLDPDGVEYRIGVLNGSNKIIVGTTLSSGEVVIAVE